VSKDDTNAKNGECVIPQDPVPAEELGRYSTQRDPHSESDISQYVEIEARGEVVQHVEKVKEEVVFGDVYEVWDVTTDRPIRLNNARNASRGEFGATSILPSGRTVTTTPRVARAPGAAIPATLRRIHSKNSIPRLGLPVRASRAAPCHFRACATNRTPTNSLAAP